MFVRCIDLSVSAVIGFTVVLVAEGGPGLAPGIVWAAAIAIAVGLVNGWLVTYRQVPPFVATFGMLVLLGGARFAYTRGSTSGRVHDGLIDVARHTFGPVTVPVIVWIGLTIVATGFVRQDGERAADDHGRRQRGDGPAVRPPGRSLQVRRLRHVQPARRPRRRAARRLDRLRRPLRRARHRARLDHRRAPRRRDVQWRRRFLHRRGDRLAAARVTLHAHRPARLEHRAAARGEGHRARRRARRRRGAPASAAARDRSTPNDHRPHRTQPTQKRGIHERTTPQPPLPGADRHRLHRSARLRRGDDRAGGLGATARRPVLPADRRRTRRSRSTPPSSRPSRRTASPRSSRDRSTGGERSSTRR